MRRNGPRGGVATRPREATEGRRHSLLTGRAQGVVRSYGSQTVQREESTDRLGTKSGLCSLLRKPGLCALRGRRCLSGQGTDFAKTIGSNMENGVGAGEMGSRREVPRPRQLLWG